MKALRILVVEDDAMIGMLLAEMLTGLGHEVDAVAATEADAVAAAARYRPNLIIADAQLREGNGISAVDTILKSGFVAHMFMSGAAIPARGWRAVVLSKPFVEADLVRAIARVLADEAAFFANTTI